MTKHVPVSLALVSFLSAGASLAHGSMEVPISRVYNCYKEGPESPDSAACKAAVAAGGTQAFYDWNGVRRGEANDQHRAQIPDGKLCSANNESFKALDLARSDWPARRIVPGSNGKFEFVYHVTAPHATKYFRFYVTRNGYNPSQPLKWSDLEATPFCEATSLTPQNSRYRVSCPLPAGKQGRHLIYNIWQRSDSPEAFYACIDVDLGATTLTDTGWKELDTVQAREELPAGSRVTFRVFDRDGRDVELHDLRLSEEKSSAANWLMRLAQQVNASSRYVRVGSLDEKGKILPVEAAQGHIVYAQEEGYRVQIDVEKPTPTEPCNH
ncbi:lytic polysaccharide monooxygenase [Stigmatella aurantiaca]|uniref:Chitin-binding protein n=1 Tax=Stigmatella aurantiaca (strain DW4/3-1) TaxID=378806 RepID=Q090U9_STIAD|nr:lytic polysaccharide monooxygenase [Stigmatella aurantiaca]ADO75682.1 Chitin-binding protein [Stigmatella aurantiaca DW4/3-1]EAU66262.1 chitin-binding protein CbpD [Stigmatella aurantiaca DW4/3-1]